MIKASQFKTRTQLEPKDNPKIEGLYLEAIDFGFSGVKGFTQDAYFCYPSYAKKVESSISFAAPKKTDIQYRDEAGNLWDVGEGAIATISASESNESDDNVYGRNRYFTDMFKVLIETGLVLGIKNPDLLNKDELCIQTGLPPTYMAEDEHKIINSMAGKHHFWIKVGTGAWIEYDFELKKENVFVMPQPMGSLFSAIVGPNGNMLEIAKDILNSNVLVFDGGFKTFDIFPVRFGKPLKGETFDNLGMREVFSRTCKKIMERYQVNIPVFVLQNKLEDGEIKVLDDPVLLKRSSKSFEDILNEETINVCEDMFKKTILMYNSFLEEKYICVTGGTGAAWMEHIKDKLKDMDELNVLGANKNDNLPHIYSNVRGYYMFLYRFLKKQRKT